jgi:hypothetical protein
MAFDPCGTRKLEGDEILKRLANILGVSAEDLGQALLEIACKKHVENALATRHDFTL